MSGFGGVRWVSVAALGALLASSCGSPTEAVDAGSATSTSVAVTVSPDSTVVTTTTLVAPPLLPEDELIQLQLDCVYGGQAEACDKLVTSGYPSAGNYGLGNSLTQAPDTALVEKCNGGWRLMCAELLVRYPDTNGAPPSNEPVPTLPRLSDQQRVFLQVDCVYSGLSEACGQLVAAGFTVESNYGLGNSYTQAPDEALGVDCLAGDYIACAETGRRNPPAPGDDIVASNFVAALISGAPLDGLAPPYLADYMAGTQVTITSIPEAGLVYDPATGALSFSLVPTTGWLCVVGNGQVRVCGPRGE